MNFADDSKPATKACHVTIRADDNAHVTERRGSVAAEVESARYLNVLWLLISEQQDLDTDGLNELRCLEINITWVGTVSLP